MSAFSSLPTLSLAQPLSAEPLQWQSTSSLSPVTYGPLTGSRLVDTSATRLALPSALTSRLSVIGGGGGGEAVAAAGYSAALSGLFTDMQLAPLEANSASVASHLLLHAVSGTGRGAGRTREGARGGSDAFLWGSGGAGPVPERMAALELRPLPTFLPPPTATSGAADSSPGGSLHHNRRKADSNHNHCSSSSTTTRTTTTTVEHVLPPLLEPAVNYLRGDDHPPSGDTALTLRPISQAGRGVVSFQLPPVSTTTTGFSLPPALPTPSRYRPHLQRRRRLSLLLPERNSPYASWRSGGDDQDMGSLARSTSVVTPPSWEQDYAVMPPQVNYLRCGDADSVKARRGFEIGPRRTFFLGLPPPAPQSSSLLFSSGSAGRRDISCPRYCLPQVCAIQSAVNPPLL